MTYNVCLPFTDFNFIIFTDFTSDELYFLYLPMIFFCKIKLPHILCIICCPQLLAYNFVEVIFIKITFSLRMIKVNALCSDLVFDLSPGFRLPH